MADKKTTDLGGKSRINFAFEVEERDELDKLKADMRLTSVIDVLRIAIRLLRIIFNHQKNGGSLIMRDKDGKDETVRFLFI